MEKEKKTKPKSRAVKPKAEKIPAKTKKPAAAVKKTAAAPVKSPEKTGKGIKKQYSKTRASCKVSLVFPAVAAPSAQSVCVAGDFNNWSITEHPLKQLKSGDFTITLDLEPGRDYQFRYIIDSSRWENDWNADKYVPTGIGDSENSVIIV